MRSAVGGAGAGAEGVTSGDHGTVGPDNHPDRLRSDEVALVLRRAADLEAHAAGRAADDGFDTAAVEEAAREVGLSPAAVRQALAELQTGALTVEHRRRGLATRSSPSIVQVARLVPCAPAVVHSTAEQYLRKQTFELRRRQDQTVLYRQRRDVAASLRRAVDLSGAIQLEGVSAITLTVTPVGQADGATGGDEAGRCMVRMVAELRGRAVMNTLANVAGLTVAGMIGVTGLVFGADPVVIGALPVGAGVTVGGLAIGHKWWRHRREQVAEVLGGLLDSLEK